MLTRERQSAPSWAAPVDAAQTDRRYKRYSSTPCPHCGELKLKRIQRPARLRLLRRVGIDIRTYSCSGCERRVRLRHRTGG